MKIQGYKHDCRDYIVPRFNEFANELHSAARDAYVAWRDAGRPRSGSLCSDMRRSRLRFRYTLRHCRQNEQSIRADMHAKAYLEKDMVSFWKGMKKENISRLPLPSKVDSCVGEEEISNMWQIHYQSLLNSVESTQHKASVKLETTNILNSSKISFTPIDISNAFKSLKLGKACGVDGVSAEHFLYAHNVLHVLLSLLFTSFITHGYLPPDFMKTALVPIIKNKTGDTSDKNNYRPIALVTAASKIFEICILELLELYLITHDHQFGFKSKHSTDMCIFTVRSIIKYYTRQNSPVYTCFLDTSKAFDRINHWTLFKKLIDCNVPLLIVRILVFWYQMQLVCVKWGKSFSQYFSIANGVRQGGILSPKLFALYMNGLSGALSLCKAGCYIDAQCMNHLMYADDICVMAPSAIALQKLLDVCYEYGITNDLIYNPLNSVCMVFKPRRFKLYCPTVAIGDECLKYVDSFKYLGFVFSENKKDDADMLRQLRSLYAKANRITRMFHYCTVDVKLLLIKSYCTSFYCGYLWSDYKASSFSKLRVAFNNVYRRVLGLPPWSSASGMYATHNIENFEALLRKTLYGFVQRLENSSNKIIASLIKSWTVRFVDWHCWISGLYT